MIRKILLFPIKIILTILAPFVALEIKEITQVIIKDVGNFLLPSIQWFLIKTNNLFVTVWLWIFS